MSYESDGEDLLAWWAMERHRQTFTDEDRSVLMLISADGCSKMIEWNGAPPWIIRTPVYRTVSMSMVQSEAFSVTDLPPPAREYEQWRSLPNGTYEYREVVR